MNTTFAIAVAALGAALLGGAARSQERETVQKPAEPKWVEKTAVAQGVELTVTVPSQNPAGGPVPVRISVRNHTDAKHWQGYVQDGAAYVHPILILSVIDARGQPVPPTVFGRGKWRDRLFGPHSGDFRTFKLSQDETYRVVVNLCLLFDLTLPGTYRLMVKDLIDPQRLDGFEIMVSDLEFSVTEPRFNFEKAAAEPEPTANAVNGDAR